jgi:hypothetical protein
MRYNVDLSRSGLAALGLPHIRPQDVQRMDSTDHIAELKEVGQAGARSVSEEHFEGFLHEAAAIG